MPSLEEPPAGTTCPRCGEELRVEGFCAVCFERELQAREAVIERDLAAARTRARTWKLHRVANS